MENRVTHYVSRKNPLVWLAAILMLGSAGLRIAYFCGKGADATTMWLQMILPVAAGLIYCCIILLDGREHFYRTLIPVVMFSIYYLALMVSRDVRLRYVVLIAALLVAFCVFYKQLTSGHVHKPVVLCLMHLRL